MGGTYCSPRKEEQVKTFSNTEFVGDFWELSGHLSDILRPMMPSDAELTKEFARACGGAGVEVMPTRGAGRYLVVGETSYKRTKMYASVLLDNEMLHAGRNARAGAAAADIVRSEMLAGARAHGEAARKKALGYRWTGYAVPQTAAVRVFSVGIVHAYGGDAFAAFDHTSDAVAVHIRAIYTITPCGAEVTE